jgi:putative peptide zinc metalloprotease protein
MRYDAYYLFSDACELPNLDERARERLHRFLAALVFGIALPASFPVRERKAELVLAYALVSTVYRWLLLAGVLWMLYSVLRPYRLEVIAIFATGLSLIGVVAMPISETVGELRNPFFWQRISPRQVGARMTVLALLLAAVLFVPWPCRVSGPGVLESAHTQSLYATTPGRIVNMVAPGTDVKASQTVIELDSADARLEVARLSTEAQRLAARVRALETLRGVDPNAASEIPAAQEALADVQRQLEQRQQELDRLTLKAAHAGRVIEPARRAEAASEIHLAKWSASPLAAFNRGATVEAGTLLAYVVDPNQLEVRVLLDQANIGLIAVGQQAYVSPWQSPGKILSGEVVEVSRVQSDDIPPALAASGDILTHATTTGEREPLTPQYQVRITLHDIPAHPIFGGRCTARIVTPWQSLASRVYRYWRQTFGRS